MFSIGEFARHGRVSVRMLRHYDAIGLIRPACVDVATGYRFYEASQLDELNRVIALKDLGFTLQQVQAILEEKVSAAELRGMLKLRRAEIQATIDAETTRLARVEARLMTIEDGARVPADGVVIKRLAPVRVAELTGVAASYEPEAITPVIQPLYHDLWHRLASADIPAAGHGRGVLRGHAPGRHPRARRRARGRRGRGVAPTASASWTCPRWTARRPSSTTAPWTTCCRPARRWRGGSTPTGTAPRPTPARSR